MDLKKDSYLASMISISFRFQQTPWTQTKSMYMYEHQEHSVLIFLLCKQSNQNNSWEFAHTARLCS